MKSDRDPLSRLLDAAVVSGAVLSWSGSDWSEWVAYTHPPEAGGRVNVWARQGDREVCRIAEPLTIWPARF